MDVSQVLSNLFVGTFPSRSLDIDRLQKDFGVTAVLNVQTDSDMAFWGVDWHRMETDYREAGIDVRRVPVPDYPDDLRRNLPQCVAVLDGLLRQRHTVYVHCNVGVNRSPSIAIAYLHWVLDWSLEEATAHVRTCRSCDPYVEAIRLANEDRADGPDVTP